MMCHQLFRNYRIIRVMFWSFPYLLWQAFGHWSGFIVGVIVAVVLTAMLNSLAHAGNWNTASPVRQQSFQTTDAQPQDQEAQAYQRGYRAEMQPYRAGSELRQARELQPEYEEMQVSYPQETMPPMEQQ